MTTSAATEPAEPRVAPSQHDDRFSLQRVVGVAALVAGAVLFLFPFYYMIVGSLQRAPDTGISGAFPNPGNLTLANFADINTQVDLVRTLMNSGIFTGGVLLATFFIGLLAGYALAQLEFRGRSVVFNAMMLILVLPFQLFMIPLYVLIVRSYGLADSYLGMILPFAVNATAVFIFRQFFLQLPRDLFDSARIDGGSEIAILRHIAIPLARPAIVTAMIVTFIGPWNEFLWPFLITKQHDLQPLAVALANYISTVAARATNPFGSILAGAVVLVIPAVIVFVIFQREFIESNLGSAVKG